MNNGGESQMMGKLRSIIIFGIVLFSICIGVVIMAHSQETLVEKPTEIVVRWANSRGDPDIYELYTQVRMNSEWQFRRNVSHNDEGDETSIVITVSEPNVSMIRCRVRAANTDKTIFSEFSDASDWLELEAYSKPGRVEIELKNDG